MCHLVSFSKYVPGRSVSRNHVNTKVNRVEVGAAGDSGSQLSTATAASEDMRQIVAKLRGMLVI